MYVYNESIIIIRRELSRTRYYNEWVSYSTYVLCIFGKHSRSETVDYNCFTLCSCKLKPDVFHTGCRLFKPHPGILYPHSCLSTPYLHNNTCTYRHLNTLQKINTCVHWYTLTGSLIREYIPLMWVLINVCTNVCTLISQEICYNSNNIIQTR